MQLLPAAVKSEDRPLARDIEAAAIYTAGATEEAAAEVLVSICVVV